MQTFREKMLLFCQKKYTNNARKTNMDAYSKQKLGLASTKFIFKKNCEIPRESLRNTQKNLRIFFKESLLSLKTLSHSQS